MFIISTGSPCSHFLSSPLAHVSELGDGSNSSNDDNNDNEVVEKDAKMHDLGASSAKKATSAKKPPAGKPDPTAAIASSFVEISLQSQPKIRSVQPFRPAPCPRVSHGVLQGWPDALLC